MKCKQCGRFTGPDTLCSCWIEEARRRTIEGDQVYLLIGKDEPKTERAQPNILHEEVFG